MFQHLVLSMMNIFSFPQGTSTGKVASPSLKAAVSHISPIQRTKVLKIDLHLSELEVISPANKAD